MLLYTILGIYANGAHMMETLLCTLNGKLVYAVLMEHEFMRSCSSRLQLSIETPTFRGIFVQ